MQIYNLNKTSSKLLSNFLIKNNNNIQQLNSRSYSNAAATNKIEDRNRNIYFLSKFDPTETVI
jgi:hypothetical protein